MASKKNGKGANQKSALLGVQADKETQFGDWYTQVLLRSEMIDYYDVSGCYILRPWSFAVWEKVQQFFDSEIKKRGVKNAYFPLFVSNRALETEKDHIADFAPEVAWVTRSGNHDLAEPIAIRPTSETIMYPAYKNWIRSHRDLPLLINQWANVVRWEFKAAMPFIRSREFLWQEGHTAYATFDEAAKEVDDILRLYAQVYEDVLAVPVIKGRKSEKEKFAGGLYTTTVEAFIPSSGRGIQAATSHCLGQNFSKMFNIEFEDDHGKRALVWQNSWGLTTRSVGIAVMVHGDNKGLVLPPRAAPVQVVIIPIYMKTTGDELDVKARELIADLRKVGVSVELDSDRVHNPGFKFNHWEVRGVPIRIELGPRDLAAQQVVACRRDTGEKATIPMASLVDSIVALLDTIQKDMLARAKAIRDDRVKQTLTWDAFADALSKRCLAIAPWCQRTSCEEEVKKRSALVPSELIEKKKEEAESSEFQALNASAKTLCIPWDQPALSEGTPCFACLSEKALVWCLFGRSY